MTPEQIEEAARLLLSARGDHRQLPGLPESCRPESEEDGYRVQDELVRLWGLDVSGWKVGATLPKWQEMVGSSGPIAGRLFAPYVYASPAELFGGAFHVRILESEYAYRLGKDLPPRGTSYIRAEVEDAVASVHPAIEIVDTRYTVGMKAGAPNLIADNSSGAAFVYAEAIPDWRDQDLLNHPVRLVIDGETVAQGTGAEAGGDPFLPLLWLANDRASRGDGLRASHFVTTSSCTGIYQTPAQCTAVADFGALGRVELSFTD